MSSSSSTLSLTKQRCKPLEGRKKEKNHHDFHPHIETSKAAKSKRKISFLKHNYSPTTNKFFRENLKKRTKNAKKNSIYKRSSSFSHLVLVFFQRNYFFRLWYHKIYKYTTSSTLKTPLKKYPISITFSNSLIPIFE